MLLSYRTVAQRIMACEFGECVGILPFVDDQNVIMVRQYRYVHHEDHRWEMPAGGISPGKTPEQAAQRELMEEGGYRANQLIWVGSYYILKSVCHETAHLSIRRGLVAADSSPDDTEFFERAVMPFGEVLRMIETSDIRDSMTVIAALHAACMHALGKL